MRAKKASVQRSYQLKPITKKLKGFVREIIANQLSKQEETESLEA